MPSLPQKSIALRIELIVKQIKTLILKEEDFRRELRRAKVYELKKVAVVSQFLKNLI